ncbi:MAG: hypothetical protein CMQ21_13435 [Gammaproteobacteria bacterium]|jgi:hypothetical protein|nr:hypothetical protein [Gammaproteobacteria bacterium]|tara:strand:- start:7327 stop:7545 length:219 start_codon:yes stop_codon:yes gene_type:complete
MLILRREARNEVRTGAEPKSSSGKINGCAGERYAVHLWIFFAVIDMEKTNVIFNSRFSAFVRKWIPDQLVPR